MKEGNCKVLSVDWDFFFPDMEWFDWGHRESPFFLEGVWQLRANNHHLKTHEHVLDCLKPDRELLRGFWEKACEFNPEMLVVAESHAVLFQILKELDGPCDVANFDSHHDCGYGQTEELECGNWVALGKGEGLIEGYHLVYPSWRREAEEGKRNVEPDLITYSNQPWPQGFYNLIFICRSGCWTPPWFDGDWFRFIQYWKHRAPLQWKHRGQQDLAFRHREPKNLQEARQVAKGMDLLWKSQQKKQEKKKHETAIISRH